MDAYERTHPILATTSLLSRRRRHLEPAADALADARRYVGQLPLGLTIVRPLTAASAAAEVERALAALAAAEGLPVDLHETAPVLARRLLCARAVVAPAVDAVAALLPAIARGASIEGLRLAELLVAYLEHRAVIARRFPSRR